jgi:hypothetical protein
MMATVERTATYEVRRVKAGKPKSLQQTRALATAFEAPPSAEEMRARQEAIGETRRTVRVPDVSARAAAREETVSAEPEADIQGND